MALWKPNPTAIGKNEFIGRRLFPRQGLKGASDQTRPNKTFEIYHFLDKGRDVSVDRLGETSVDRKVKGYLNPRGHYAASLMHKAEFQGWAVTQAKEIHAPQYSYQLSPSPIAAQVGGPVTPKGEPLTENNFHAHIERPDRLTRDEMAVMLKYIFEKNYRLEPCIPSRKREGWFSRAKRWLCGLWGH